MSEKKAKDLTEEELLESLLKIVQHHRSEFYKAQNKTDYSDVIDTEVKKLLGSTNETNLGED